MYLKLLVFPLLLHTVESAFKNCGGADKTSGMGSSVAATSTGSSGSSLSSSAVSTSGSHSANRIVRTRTPSQRAPPPRRALRRPPRPHQRPRWSRRSQRRPPRRPRVCLWSLATTNGSLQVPPPPTHRLWSQRRRIPAACRPWLQVIIVFYFRVYGSLLRVFRWAPHLRPPSLSAA